MFALETKQKHLVRFLCFLQCVLVKWMLNSGLTVLVGTRQSEKNYPQRCKTITGEKRASFNPVCCSCLFKLQAAGFFMVADPSVGAVKHSGVFSCDWDSLDEENVRHGAWLSVCWSSSRGLRKKGYRLSFPPHPGSVVLFLLPSLPRCFLSPSLSLPSFFSSPLASLNGGSSLVIHWSPLSVPHQPTSPASLSATTHNYSIKAPRGLAAWLMLTKEFIVVDLCSQSQSSVLPLLHVLCGVALRCC